MKKLVLLLTFILTIFQGFSQTKGISYQAVILNPEAQEIPGVNVQGNILANTAVGIQFTIIDASGTEEYQESHTTSTDKYGMLNLLIGTGNPSSSTDFSDIYWDGTAKKLKVSIDFMGGSNYQFLSEQNLTYMPQPPTDEVIATIEANTEAIGVETVRATAAEAAIQSDVDANQTASELADATLTIDLAAEVSRATAAEAAIQSDVDANQTANELADATLTIDLAAEVSRATAAEGVLTANLATEVADRIADVNEEEARAMFVESIIRNELNVTQVGAGLATDGTYTKNTSANYIAAATALNDADNKLDTQIKVISDELNVTQAGAGLGTDGTYTANVATNYMKTSTTLVAATEDLDAQVKINAVQIGEIKQTIASTMPAGWVKLDGAAISTLTITQQTQATNLGLSGNLPNATNAYLSQNGSALGTVSGSNSKTIARNNLPNVTLSGSTNSTGNHSHYIYGNTSDDLSGAGGNIDWVLENKDGAGAGEYTAAAGTHSHSVTTSSINGGVTQQALNITPNTLSVNTYIYLGQ